MVKLHIVPLEGEERVAIVHPQSGAFAYLEGQKEVALLKERNGMSTGDTTHQRLSEEDPLFEEFAQATQSFRDRAETRASDELNTVIVKITNRCNEACMHCYDAHGADDKDAEEDQLRKALGESIALSGPLLNILFHGGEPFLRLDMIERLAEYSVQEAARQGKQVSFYAQTNASIFNDRIVALLKKYNFRLGISLDGWEELHDELRVMHDGSSTYRLFKRSYDRHKEYLIQNTGILTTVMATNIDHLPEIVLHCRDMGFLTWETTLFDLIGRGALYPNLAVDPEKYCASMMRIVDLIEAGELDNFAVRPILARLDNLLRPQKHHMCLPGNSHCGAGKQLLSFASNGDVFGCDLIFDQNLKLGALPATTLSEAMASPLVTDMVERLDKNLNHCHGCTWLGVCGGTCLARSSLTSVNAIDCKISQIINPQLLDRLAKDDRLLKWYRRFPLNLRSAQEIHRDMAKEYDEA